MPEHSRLGGDRLRSQSADFGNESRVPRKRRGILPTRDGRGTILRAMNALGDLPFITDQTAFNLDRWDELCADPLWVEVEGKIETDRYGQVIVNPPTEYSHGGKQFDLGTLLARHAPS